MLQEQIAAADGLLLATPEYNNSIPGVFKNAIDWLSRPPSDIARIFGNRPVTVIGASTGRFGTVLSQSAWLPVLRALGMHPWFVVDGYSYRKHSTFLTNRVRWSMKHCVSSCKVSSLDLQNLFKLVACCGAEIINP